MTQYGIFTEPTTIRFERLLPGPIERVWSYLVDPEKRGTWFAAGPMELREGGEIELIFRNDHLSPKTAPRPERFKDMPEEIRTVGTVLSLEPPHRLTFRWGEAHEEDLVTFELSPEGEKVRLVLTHERLTTASGRRDVPGGWHTHLAVLEAVLAGETPESFWTLWNETADYYSQLSVD